MRVAQQSNFKKNCNDRTKQFSQTKPRVLVVITRSKVRFLFLFYNRQRKIDCNHCPRRKENGLGWDLTI